MNKEKIEIIQSYLNNNVAPLLIENVPLEVFPTAIILSANCDITELNGHYEGAEFVSPKWYQKLLSKTETKRVLIISNIDEVSKEEQEKFKEILKYKKISTFDLPNNTIIVLTYKNLRNVSSEVTSLVATIKE